MVKKLILCVVLFLLVLPIVLAQTTINIKTLKFHDVTITILEPIDVYSSIQSFPNIYSGLEGEVSIEYTGTKTQFHIKVLAKKNGQVILNEQFNNKNAGGIINIELYPEGYDVPEDEDDNETTGDDNETTEEDTLMEDQTEEDANSQGITGLIVGEDEDKEGLSWVFYAVVAIILVGVIGLVVAKGMQMRRPPHETKEMRNSKTDENKSQLDHKLSDSERKIIYLEKEIKKLKNKEKIEEMEKKIKEEQGELERLKGGENREEAERLRREEEEMLRRSQEQEERLRKDED